MLRALPNSRFEYGEWHFTRMRIDYHVEVEGHYYSAPHRPSDEPMLDVRVSASTIEIYVRGQRVAAHAHSHNKGRHTTDPASHAGVTSRARRVVALAPGALGYERWLPKRRPWSP